MNKEQLKEIFVNDYEIRFNPFWNTFQVSHDNIGANIAEFNTLQEAKEFCEKG